MDEPSQPPDHQEEGRLLAQGMRYFGVASQFAVTLAVLGYVGYWLDETRGWSPWGVLAGIFTGMTIGVWSMLRQLARMEHNDKR